MGSLAYTVLDFIDRLRKQPDAATDPRLLARLERFARESWDGAFVALHAPMAPLTWEARALLPSASPETNRIPLRFPRPVEILGFFPTVIDTDAATGVSHTLNTLDVSLDINATDRVTSGEGVSTAAGGTAGTFVTLAALGIQAPRLVGLKLRNSNPDMGFVFRSKRGSGVFNSALVTVATFARYIDN
jgi:hypothetical protein